MDTKTPLTIKLSAGIDTEFLQPTADQPRRFKGVAQPVHSSASTVCMSLEAPRMASTGQALMQAVQPMQAVSSI